MDQDASFYGGGLGLRDIVLDGYPAPPPLKGHSPSPNYRLMYVRCGQTARWTMVPLGMEVGLGPGDFFCVRWGPSYPQIKGTTTPPNFWPMSIVAKRLDGRRHRLVRK